VIVVEPPEQDFGGAPAKSTLPASKYRYSARILK
jgi:hypothetical protein